MVYLLILLVISSHGQSNNWFIKYLCVQWLALLHWHWAGIHTIVCRHISWAMLFTTDNTTRVFIVWILSIMNNTAPEKYMKRDYYCPHFHISTCCLRMTKSLTASSRRAESEFDPMVWSFWPTVINLFCIKGYMLDRVLRSSCLHRKHL